MTLGVTVSDKLLWPAVPVYVFIPLYRYQTAFKELVKSIQEPVIFPGAPLGMTAYKKVLDMETV